MPRSVPDHRIPTRARNCRVAKVPDVAPCRPQDSFKNVIRERYPMFSYVFFSQSLYLHRNDIQIEIAKLHIYPTVDTPTGLGKRED